MFALLSASRRDLPSGFVTEHPDFAELARLPVQSRRSDDAQTMFQRDYGRERIIADKSIGLA